MGALGKSRRDPCVCWCQCCCGATNCQSRQRESGLQTDPQRQGPKSAWSTAASILHTSMARVVNSCWKKWKVATEKPRDPQPALRQLWGNYISICFLPEFTYIKNNFILSTEKAIFSEKPHQPRGSLRSCENEQVKKTMACLSHNKRLYGFRSHRPESITRGIQNRRVPWVSQG